MLLEVVPSYCFSDRHADFLFSHFILKDKAKNNLFYLLWEAGTGGVFCLWAANIKLGCPFSPKRCNCAVFN